MSQSTSGRTTRSAIAVAILAALILGGTALTAGAFQESTRSRTTGPSGWPGGQTARLNVASLGGPDTHPEETCTATLTFFNAAGAVLRQSRVELAPGQSALELLGFREVDPAASSIRASVEIGDPNLIRDPEDIGDPHICPAVATLEIVEAGKTVLVLNAATPLGLPRPQ